MNLIQKSEFFPIQMIWAVGFWKSETLHIELLTNFGKNIKQLEAMDNKYPFIEAFAETFDQIYVITVWLIEKEVTTIQDAYLTKRQKRAYTLQEEILIKSQTQEIADNYLKWLQESK